MKFDRGNLIIAKRSYYGLEHPDYIEMFIVLRDSCPYVDDSKVGEYDPFTIFCVKTGATVSINLYFLKFNFREVQKISTDGSVELIF